MANPIHRTIHYRAANILPPLPLTLKAMLQLTTAHNPLPIDRTQVLKAGNQITWNDQSAIGSTLCGLVLRYTPGDNQLVVDQDPTSAVWKIHEVPPAALSALATAPVVSAPASTAPSISPPSASSPAPAPAVANSTATKRDFLPAILYFGIQDNHLAAVQATHFDADNLADYLMWLLRKTPTTGFTAQHRLLFAPANAFNLRQKGIDRAKAIKIKVPLAEDTVATKTFKNGKTKSFFKKVINQFKALKITEAMDSLGVNAPATLFNSPQAEDLEIRLEIRRPYNRDSMGNPVMNELAKILASNSSSDFTIVMPDNVEINGNTLKVHKDVEFSSPTGSKYPIALDVFKELDLYVNDLIASGHV